MEWMLWWLWPRIVAEAVFGARRERKETRDD